jgi:hypothetical protein
MRCRPKGAALMGRCDVCICRAVSLWPAYPFYSPFLTPFRSAQQCRFTFFCGHKNDPVGDTNMTLYTRIISLFLLASIGSLAALAHPQNGTPTRHEFPRYRYPVHSASPSASHGARHHHVSHAAQSKRRVLIQNRGKKRMFCQRTHGECKTWRVALLGPLRVRSWAVLDSQRTMSGRSNVALQNMLIQVA